MDKLSEIAVPRSLRWAIAAISTLTILLLASFAYITVSWSVLACFAVAEATHRITFAILPLLPGMGVVAAFLIFVSRLMGLHSETVRRRPLGWIVWSREGGVVVSSFGDITERIVAFVDDVRKTMGAPELGRIKLRQGHNFAAYLERGYTVIEIGVFSLAALDAVELRAILAHEFGHILDRRVLSRHEMQVHSWALYDFLQEHMWDPGEDDAHEDSILARLDDSSSSMSTGLGVVQIVKALCLGLAERIFFSSSLWLTKISAERSLSSSALRECEFNCDRAALACSSPEDLARALMRHTAVSMAFARFSRCLLIPSFRQYRYRSWIGALAAVQVCLSDTEGISRARRGLLEKETPTHPSTASRIIAILKGRADIRGEAMPAPSTIVTISEALEVWESLSDEEFGPGIAAHNQNARDYPLNFRGLSIDEMREELALVDRELRRESALVADVLDLEAPGGGPGDVKRPPRRSRRRSRQSP